MLSEVLVGPYGVPVVSGVPNGVPVGPSVILVCSSEVSVRFPCIPMGFWYGFVCPAGPSVVLVGSPWSRCPRGTQCPALPAAPAMRLYSLSVLYKGEARVQLLKAASDVSTFNFFQRSR